MDVKRRLRMASVAFAIAMLSALSSAQSRSPSYDPAGHEQSLRSHDGLLDSTLKHVNPSDKDYGQFVDHGRSVLVAETVRNRYFWSNVVALGALGCSFLIILFQHRTIKRREWTTAEILAQFEHSLQRSRAQADEASQKNHAFQEALAKLRESTLPSVLPSSDSDEISGAAAATTRVVPPRTAAAPSIRNSPGTKSASARNYASHFAAEPSNQMALFKADAALIVRVNALEQELARSEEQQKELRRQLIEAGRKFNAEPQKNRAFKGA